MYITVGIDSENYTELYYSFYEDGMEAKNVVEEEFADLESEYSWTFEPETESFSFLRRYATDDDTMYWSVTEIHKVNKKYNVVYWHAYNGVGFDVRSFDTYEEASEYLAKDAKEFADQIREEDLVTCEIDSNSAVIDDNYEWHIWVIIKTPEGK